MGKPIEPEEARRIGQLLKTARLRNRQTLKEIARSIRVDSSQISRIERGDFKRISRNVQKMCSYLHIPVSDIKDQARRESEISDWATRVAAQSPKNRMVLEALLMALDDY